MISIARLNARGQNQRGDNIVDYLLDTEKLASGYYTDGQDPLQDAMRYGGKLANDPDLDLLGKPVTREVMVQLAAGFSPTGKPLCKNAGEEPQEVLKTDRQGNPRLDEEGNEIRILKGGHRVGFDMTHTPFKGASVLFAIADGQDRDDILDACRRATASSMGYLEDKVETRRGAGGKVVMGVKGLIYSQHEHYSNRNLEPNVHHHVLVFGISKGQDDAWGTFDAREIYRHRMAADAIYQSEVAMNLRDLGYEINTTRHIDDEGKETGRVEYTVAGLPNEFCEKFSSRRQEILDYQEEHGVNAQTACLSTRKHKEEPPFEEMEAMWKQTMETMDMPVPTIEQIKQASCVQFEPATDEQVLEKLHQGEAIFTDNKLVERLGLEHGGRLRKDKLLAKVEEFKEKAGLVRIEPERIAEEDRGVKPGRIHTEDRFAAKWMVDWEEEIVHRVGKRNDEDHQKVAPEKVSKAIDRFEKKRGFQLSDEQRTAITHITAETGGVAIMSGFAGTGKTTVSDCYSEILRGNGRRMMGLCVSNKAAKNLENESGMPCMSVAKFLTRIEDKNNHNNKIELKAHDVIVVDESGMLDTDNCRRILGHADRAGAKVIFQGDLMQLQPVGAGSGMSLAKMATGDVKLTEVRRQSREEDREFVRDFYGDDLDMKKGTRSRRETLELGTKLMAGLQARGCLDEFNTRPQCLKALVSDYLANPAPADEKLVLAHTRADVALLNAEIRKGLKESGQLEKEAITMPILDDGKKAELELSRGDRLRFTKSDNKLDVVNGTCGVLKDYKPNERRGGHDLSIELEGGKLLKMNTVDCPHLTHDFNVTVHKAQGAGKSEVFHLAHTGMMDNHSSLVAFSRLTKGNYRMYGTGDDFEVLHERLGLERLKGTALDAGLRKDAPPASQEGPLSKKEQGDVEQSLRAFCARLDERRSRTLTLSR